jgi:hypothetical protein
VWFHLAGFQLEVLWQFTQLTVVGMCCAFLPAALLPLWQLVQLVADVNPLWSMPVAGVQAEVLWHVPHAACVTKCPEGLPAVMFPL